MTLIKCVPISRPCDSLLSLFHFFRYLVSFRMAAAAQSPHGNSSQWTMMANLYKRSICRKRKIYKKIKHEIRIQIRKLECILKLGVKLFENTPHCNALTIAANLATIQIWLEKPFNPWHYTAVLEQHHEIQDEQYNHCDCFT